MNINSISVGIKSVKFRTPQKRNQEFVEKRELTRNTNVNHMPTQWYLAQVNASNNVSFKGTEAFNFGLKYLNRSILGFAEEKNVITKKLLEPFIESFKNPSVLVPPSVLLYGPEKSVMDTFTSDIAKMKNDITNVGILDISEIPNNEIVSCIDYWLNSFKTMNKEHGIHSIIYLKEPEKHLGMNLNQAKRLLDFDYNENDLEILKSNTNNIDHINYFKSILDTCSLPANSGGYATTFLFQSEAPHLIHPDLRKGKLEKINIPRIYDDESGPLLLYLFNEHYKDLFIKAAPNEKSLIERALKLSINNFNEDEISSIVSFCQIHPHLGAYNYNDITDMAKNIFSNTITSPENHSEKFFLANELYHKERSLTPKQIIRNNRIADIFGHRTDIYKYLKNKEELGILNNDEVEFFEKFKIQNNANKKLLLEKEKSVSLTEFEKEYLKRLKEYEDE